MPNKPDDTNQLPVTPISPDSVESQSTRVVVPYTHEYISQILAENVRLKKDIDVLWFKVNHDTLTQLENRNFLLSWMKVNIGPHTPFFMLSIDLNKFKQINDKLWHDVGDAALRLMAEVIRDVNSKIGWFIVRAGGDEFVAIYTWDLTPEWVAEEIRVTLASKFNIWVAENDDNNFDVNTITNVPCYTASIGWARNTDIEKYKIFLKNEYDQKFAENNLEIEKIQKILEENDNLSHENQNELINKWKLFNIENIKITKEFNEIYNNINYNIVWKIAERALKFAKREENHIRIFDEKCLLPISWSKLIDALLEKIESELRPIKDIESVHEAFKNIIELYKEFQLNTSK